MRAHFDRPLLDPLGNRVPIAQVRVLVPGTTDLISELLFADDASGATLTNPFSIADGEVDFYLEAPRRVRLGITVGTGQEGFWDDVDVSAAATDSVHPGSGLNSTGVGLGAIAAESSTAVGVQAQATEVQATTVGHQSRAAGVQSVALGAQALALQPGATSLGSSATANGSQSTALGSGAQAPYDQTTAVGAGARATEPNQVMLGTSADEVEVASGRVVLHSPSGLRFLLSVSDSGHLYTQELGAPQIPPDPNAG